MRKICALAPVIPVLVIDDVQVAEDVASALLRGGLPVLEVTLRTNDALDVIEKMSSVPGAIVGAGTLLEGRNVQDAAAAGAKFGVSPGSIDEVLEAAERVDLPFLPGASSASEVMQLRRRGYNMLKFFPAEAAGGVEMLKGLSGPLPEIHFCPKQFKFGVVFSTSKCSQRRRKLDRNVGRQ